MAAVLVDTNVFSYLMKPRDTRGDLYRPEVKGKILAVSFITVGELYFGAKKRGWTARKVADLEDRLRSVVVVPYDLELCKQYAETRASLPKGVTVADNDLWIACCALRHGVPLITHNPRHFEQIPGLILITKLAPKEAKPPGTGELFRGYGPWGVSS